MATAMAPIGVFDSGLGGLRVLDRLVQAFPQERFVYLGDTQYMPYGEKPPQQVRQRVLAALDWMMGTHQVKLMVVACNTAAAVAPDLFERYRPIPFVDPVQPICQWLGAQADFHRVGLMATPSTVASQRYPHLLRDTRLQLTAVACDGLASLIEAGQGDTPACQTMLRHYLAPLQHADVQAIVLGCTHYPYVQAHIEAISGPNITLINPAQVMTQTVGHLLQQHGMRAVPATPVSPHPTPKQAHVDYYVTAEPDQFYQTSRRLPFTYDPLDVSPPTVIQLPTTTADIA